MNPGSRATDVVARLDKISSRATPRGRLESGYPVAVRPCTRTIAVLPRPLRWRGRREIAPRCGDRERRPGRSAAVSVRSTVIGPTSGGRVDVRVIRLAVACIAGAVAIRVRLRSVATVGQLSHEPARRIFDRCRASRPRRSQVPGAPNCHPRRSSHRRSNGRVRLRAIGTPAIPRRTTYRIADRTARYRQS